jgi:Tol biopolymer transport system component
VRQSGIFISYRREDAAHAALLLHDRLSASFGEDKIFMDVDTIDIGANFPEVIDRAVRSCEVLLAVIGQEWLTSTDAEGRRRLENEDDFVRLEIARALDRNIWVIPVLVQDAKMPRPDDLPEDLQELTRRHAARISLESWNYDVGRLITGLERLLVEPEQEDKTSPLPEINGDAESVTVSDEREAEPEPGDEIEVDAGTEKWWARVNRKVWIASATVAAVLLASVLIIVGGGDDEDGATLAGTRIAFLSDKSGSCEIHVVRADGTHQRQLTHTAGSDLRADWSPDGSQVVFASNADGDYDLYLLDVDSGRESLLLDNGGDERGPDWSPDGGKIAFSSTAGGHSEIWVMDVDEAQADQLTYYDAHSIVPDWSRDGKRIAFASNADGAFDIHLMRTDGAEHTNLTGEILGDDSDEFDPSWSPDGDTLSFDARPAGGDFDIYVIQSDGSGVENLTAHSAEDRHSSWAPDGSMIVFGSDREVPPDDTQRGCSAEERQQDLFMMNDDGSDQERLFESEADDSSPAWER